MVAIIEVVKSRYPDIEGEELSPHFPRMAVLDSGPEHWLAQGSGR
jgi:hypothetical protein